MTNVRTLVDQDRAQREYILKPKLKAPDRQTQNSETLAQPLKESKSSLITTFNRTVEYKPQHIYTCHSVEDVQSAVARAAQSNMKIRVYANGYSWAPYIVSNEICLMLKGLSTIGPIDLKTKTIVVEAGTRVGDITKALEAVGLCLPSLPFENGMTIGGAISTCTHGTSPAHGSLSDAVRAITVVLPSGHLKRFGPESNIHELRAARVSIGMLGVIVSVELQAVDIPWVYYTELNLNLTQFANQLDTLRIRFRHMWVLWTLGSDHVTVKGMEPALKGQPGSQPYIAGDNAYWGKIIETNLLNNIFKFSHKKIEHFSYNAFKFLQRPKKARVRISMQYSVPTNKLSKIISAIKQSATYSKNRGQIIEIKFLKQSDNSYLGYNSDYDAALFNTYWNIHINSYNHILDDFERSMQAFGARPHWGKSHQPISLERISDIYPNWSKFEAVRAKYDPNGIFIPDCILFE